MEMELQVGGGCREMLRNKINALKPTIMMIVVQIVMAVLNVLYKLIFTTGMNVRIFVAYRFLFATAFVLPLAVVFERKGRPKLTWKILGEAFLSALFGGTLAQNLYAKSLMLTSVTYAAAIGNLVPPITFVIAVIFKLERLRWDTVAGKAKVVGTLMGLVGAMVLTLYKGPQVHIWSTHVNLLSKSQLHRLHVASSQQPSTHPHHTLGSTLAFGATVVTSLSLIFQAKLSVRYPCQYSSTALISVMGSIQSVIFALYSEHNWTQWRLGWDIRLVTAIYAGTIASGLMVTFTMTCVRMRGPLFVSIFSPLILVLIAVAGSLLLDEQLHVGTMIGSVIVIIGLYVVLWGKSKELASSKGSKGDVIRSTKVTTTTNNALGFVPTFPLTPDREKSNGLAMDRDRKQEQEQKEEEIVIVEEERVDAREGH